MKGMSNNYQPKQQHQTDREKNNSEWGNRKEKGKNKNLGGEEKLPL